MCVCGGGGITSEHGLGVSFLLNAVSAFTQGAANPVSYMINVREEWRGEEWFGGSRTYGAVHWRERIAGRR